MYVLFIHGLAREMDIKMKPILLRYSPGRSGHRIRKLSFKA